MSDPREKLGQAPLEKFEAMIKVFDEALRTAIKEEGFASTLKSLRKGRLPPTGMITVCEGVLEEQPTGLYDAALQTDRGPIVLRGAQRTDKDLDDPQVLTVQPVPTSTTLVEQLSPASLLEQLGQKTASADSCLLGEIEMTRFSSHERQILLPMLWQYIIRNRNANDRETLIGVGAAIRKYIAIMPMGRMEELAQLLESGTRSPLPLASELEIVKMVFRNFQVYPPPSSDIYPQLAKQMLDLVEAYSNPRVLVQEKVAAIVSLAIAGIVAMRSSLAERAFRIAMNCPYRWFVEVVKHDLSVLAESWRSKNSTALEWLNKLLGNTTYQPQ